jgi:hypothetical protein
MGFKMTVFFLIPSPLNLSQYNVIMTNEFNPFCDYHEGPSRREPSVERELPLYDLDDDDEVEFVPKMVGTTMLCSSIFGI